MSILKFEHFHFIGVGGIGMSAIAHLLLSSGKKVSGSDLVSNKNVENLIELGLNFKLGHARENIESSSQVVIITSAIRSSNPEYQQARDLNIKVLKRAQMLAELSNKSNTVAVAGSHGKTTTSCYLSEILINLNLKPSFALGGVLKKTKTNAMLGDGIFVIEADESDSSFHFFKSQYSIITNIDNDHVDFYGSFDELKKAFVTFMNENTKKSILNFDDRIVRDLAKSVENKISYGQKGDEDYVFSIKKMKFGKSSFVLNYLDKEVVFDTNITGDYNISNLVSTIVYLIESSIDIQKIKLSVKEIEGIKRRYDILYKTEDKVIIDDYAHHPTEIEKLINAISLDYPGFKVKTFFEPHRYTRTKNFWLEFTRCFSQTDELYLLPIYAASEDSIDGISSKRLIKDIMNSNKSYLNSLGEIEKMIDFDSAEKEVIISLGAGPISKEFRRILDAENI